MRPRVSLPALLLMGIAAPAVATPRSGPDGLRAHLSEAMEHLDGAGQVSPGLAGAISGIRVRRGTITIEVGGRNLDEQARDDLLRVAGMVADELGLRGVELVPRAEPPRAAGVPEGGPEARPDSRPAMDLPYGAPLAGRTIVLSPGHGWIWDPEMGRYRTQRGNLKFQGCGECRGITEDISNAEIVHYHLMPMLERAGARVLVVRERDFQEDEAVVDDSHEGYQERGGGFRDGASGGGFGGTYRVLEPNAEGVATWALPIEVPGPHMLSIFYRAGGNRTRDALYRITCMDGVTDYHVDQRVGDSRWVYLGEHWCEPGGATVELLHGPGSDGYVIPDAVRLGGGVDEDAGHPRWQMAAVHYIPYLGAPGQVTQRGDVTIRPAYANWEGADLYLAVHTNAFDGSSSGLQSYRYSCGTFPDWSHAPPADQCDEPPGSARLQELTHQALVESIHQRWDPAFGDRGMRVANFGEVRVLDSIPGVLFELGFHDNLVALGGTRMSDNQAIHDPRWREAACLGILEGVIRFFGGDTMPPERPEGLVAWPDPERGTIEVRWRQLPRALGYRVRVAVDSLALDSGTVVEGERFVLQDPEPGHRYYFVVSGLGRGGEGPSSEVVAARLGPRGEPVYAPTLVVLGFDREDAWVQERDNTHSYVYQHGEAMALAGPFPFGTASNEAIFDLDLGSMGVGTLDWLLGEESTEHETFSGDEQAWVQEAMAGGVTLLASGAEVGWDLDRRGSDADRTFMREVFGARYEADDADVYRVAGAQALPEGMEDLAGLAFDLDDGTHGTYDVNYPDVLQVAGGDAAVILEYHGARGPAGVANRGQVAKAVVLGFPLEAVYPAEARAALMGSLLGWLLPPPMDPPAGDDAGTGGDIGTPPEDSGVHEEPDMGVASDAGGQPDFGGPVDAALAPDLGDLAESGLDSGDQPPPPDSTPNPFLRPGSSEAGCGCSAAGRESATPLIIWRVLGGRRGR